MLDAPTWALHLAAPNGSGDPKHVPNVSSICGGLRPPLISNQELQNNLGEPPPPLKGHTPIPGFKPRIVFNSVFGHTNDPK